MVKKKPDVKDILAKYSKQLEGEVKMGGKGAIPGIGAELGVTPSAVGAGAVTYSKEFLEFKKERHKDYLFPL